MATRNPDIVALVAEDEPVLAGFLVASLRELWPALSVGRVASDGESALEHLFAMRPDVAFLDIRMPGLTGLEVARRATESWDVGAYGPLPIFVFVTAHDEHAIEAFELAAFDYLTKPIGTARLAKTVARLQATLAGTRSADVEHVVQRLETVLGRVVGARPLLETIRASAGNTVKLIGIDDVVLFEAADKYVSVVSTGGEALIRETLTSLAAQLDDRRFVRIGRSRIVNLRFVTHTERGDDGRVRLALTDRERRYPVSRAYAHRFRAM